MMKRCENEQIRPSDFCNMMRSFPNLSSNTILMSTLKIMAVVLNPLPIRMKVKTLCEKLFWHMRRIKEEKNELD